MVRRIALFVVALLWAVTLGGCSRGQFPDRPTATAAEGQALVEGRASTPRAAGTAATGSSEAAQVSVPGVPDAGAVPEPNAPPEVYVVKAGDTLYGIAARFGLDVNDLIRINQIADPSALYVGQQLQISSTSAETSPDTLLLPNSEFVNSPAYVNFSSAAVCTREGGYLCDYEENVGGHVLSGPEIVALVAHHYSVGPRLLLALLELESGWVTDPNPTGQALNQPLGSRGGGTGTFQEQLAWAADKLNEGYYNWRGRGMPVKVWPDGTRMHYASTLNAATAGLQYFFSLKTDKSDWEVLIGEGPDSFIETYRKLFGNPFQYAIEPLIPADTTVPTMALPWSSNEMWYYTGGPHGGWNDGSAWAAVDFVPDEGYLGCQVASSWERASAAGLVVYSQDGEVLIDLDGDGHEQTGWILYYLHVASDGRVPADTRVKQGDPIGHPSCEGGFSESSHLHFARRYNGEWIAADGPLPLVLSGWQFFSSGAQYDGTAARAGEQRTACECRNEQFNGLTVRK